MRIAVLFGGTSEERDVSVASGAQVVRGLEAAGHEVVAIDTVRGALTPAEREQLLATGVAPTQPSDDHLSLVRQDAPAFLNRTSELRQVDVVFIALHGGTGEDGTLQALLDLAGIPYTGSGHMGSAYAMDKDVSKRLFRSEGIPTPDWLMTPVTGADVATMLGFPVIVKPNKQGSTVGILEGAALAVGEIRPRLHEIFDYASKYQPDGAEEVFPAPLPAETTELVRRLGIQAHRSVKAGSYSRVDFRLDEAGEVWCLEVNTVPGMTRSIG